MVVNIVISLYSVRLILDALGVEDFGIYNLVGGAIAMLNFLNSAMAEASQRFMAYSLGEGYIDKQIKVFNVSLVLHFLIGIVIVISLEFLGFFLFRDILNVPSSRIAVAKLVYHFMVFSMFFTIIKVPCDAVLNAHENMLFVAILGIFESIVKLTIAIYVTYTIFDRLIVYAVLIALMSILLVIISYIYCYKKYEEVSVNLLEGIDKYLLREMGRFASWSLLSHSMYIITMQGTSIVLNSFFGVIVNAAQGIANQVSNQIKNFSTNIQKAINPIIVKREGEKNRNKMLETSMFGNKIAFFIISFLSIPVIIEMPYILDLWLKDVPKFSVIFCRLILFRMILGSLTQTFYVAIGAIGEIKNNTIWESIIFFSILPLSVIAYKFGASAEAIYIVFLILTVGIIIVRVYFLYKLGGLSIEVFLKNLVLRCLIVFIMTIILTTLPHTIFEEGFFRLILVLIVSVISLLFFVYFIGLNCMERKQIIVLLKGFLLKKGHS